MSRGKSKPQAKSLLSSGSDPLGIKEISLGGALPSLHVEACTAARKWAAKKRYYWLFTIEDEQGEFYYMGSDGEDEEDKIEFVGTPHEASEEADRRAGLWHEINGGVLCTIACERRGEYKIVAEI